MNGILLLISIPALLIVAALMLYQSFYVAEVYGNSMLPSLKPGDRLLVMRYWFPGLLRRDQLIIGSLSHLPLNHLVGSSANRVNFTKRLVGLPGDQIKVDLQKLPSDAQNRY